MWHNDPPARDAGIRRVSISFKLWSELEERGRKSDAFAAVGRGGVDGLNGPTLRRLSFEGRGATTSAEVVLFVDGVVENQMRVAATGIEIRTGQRVKSHREEVDG